MWLWLKLGLIFVIFYQEKTELKQLKGGNSRMSKQEFLQANFIGWLTAVDNSNANCSAKQFFNLSIFHSKIDQMIGRITNSFKILSNQ